MGFESTAGCLSLPFGAGAMFNGLVRLVMEDEDARGNSPAVLVMLRDDGDGRGWVMHTCGLALPLRDNGGIQDLESNAG